MVLLYPEPTILSKHTLVALTDNGARFAQVMTSNPKVSSIAQRYGFRTQDSSELFAAVEAKKFVIPHTVVDVIDPPSLRHSRKADQPHRCGAYQIRSSKRDPRSQSRPEVLAAPEAPLTLTMPEPITPIKEPDAASAMVPMKEETRVGGASAGGPVHCRPAPHGCDLRRFSLTHRQRLPVWAARRSPTARLLTGKFMEKNFVGDADNPAFKVMNEMRRLVRRVWTRQGGGSVFDAQDSGNDSIRQPAAGLLASLR